MDLDDIAPLSEDEANGLSLGEAVGAKAAAAVTRIVIPKKGPVIAEDGTCKIAVIRPCISRGKRIRDLPPIYTPKMLAEHAAVFIDWPMYRDHAVLTEAEVAEDAQALEALNLGESLEEAVKKVGRSIDDLGGRIVRSWWDPELVYEDDEDYGYEQGGVVARALPLPSVAAKIKADPRLLHTSINAWPTSGRPGTHRGIKGMLIEGIRRIPMGSVDWVVRGGAGGRVLVEGEDRKVSPLHSPYSSANGEDVDLKNMTPEQLREHVKSTAPHLLTALREEAVTPVAAQVPTPVATPVTDAPVTATQLAEALRESQEQFAATLEKETKTIREQADEGARQAREAQTFVAEAHKLIEAAAKKPGNPGGFLPGRWVADLKARYSIAPSGPAPALLVEAETSGDTVTKPAIDVLREQVTADLDYARDLIAEAAGRPVVAAQGGGGKTTPGSEPAKTPEAAAAKPAGWASSLAEMGMLDRDEDGSLKVDGLLESMVG